MGQVVTCARAAQLPGPATTIVVSATVTTDVPDGTTLTNTARVSTSTPGDKPGDNTATLHGRRRRRGRPRPHQDPRPGVRRTRCRDGDRLRHRRAQRGTVGRAARRHGRRHPACGPVLRVQRRPVDLHPVGPGRHLRPRRRCRRSPPAPRHRRCPSPRSSRRTPMRATYTNSASVSSPTTDPKPGQQHRHRPGDRHAVRRPADRQDAHRNGEGRRPVALRRPSPTPDRPRRGRCPSPTCCRRRWPSCRPRVRAGRVPRRVAGHVRPPTPLAPGTSAEPITLTVRCWLGVPHGRQHGDRRLDDAGSEAAGTTRAPTPWPCPRSWTSRSPRRTRASRRSATR